MNSLQFRLLTIGGALMALAIILGVFGAHIIKEHITSDLYETYKTANFYHRFHSLAILLLITFVKKLRSNQVKVVAWLFGLGILFFSGSLYFYSVSEIILGKPLSIAGLIAPVGGLLFISGWMYLTVIGWSNFKKASENE